MPRKSTSCPEDVKLYKFRSLSSDQDLDKAKEILQTGKFWFSKLWELNDPMEGVYRTAAGGTDVEQIFGEKNKRLICSFSKSEALRNPLMWGYYANGLKGIAIEITISPNEVRNIEYVDALPVIHDVNPVERLLATKLSPWKHEQEARIIIQAEQSGLHPIGRISGLYIGKPYKNTMNSSDIYRESQLLSDYSQNVSDLIKVVPNQVEVHVMRFNGSILECSKAGEEEFKPNRGN